MMIQYLLKKHFIDWLKFIIKLVLKKSHRKYANITRIQLSSHSEWYEKSYKILIKEYKKNITNHNENKKINCNRKIKKLY
jgi:hypothetical protein